MDCIVEQWFEIDTFKLNRLTVVQVGEEQEILDQTAHSSSRLADAPHGIIACISRP